MVEKQSIQVMHYFNIEIYIEINTYLFIDTNTYGQSGKANPGENCVHNSKCHRYLDFSGREICVFIIFGTR